MFCRKCGAELKEGSRFCHSCGTTLVQQFSNTQPVWQFILLSLFTFNIYVIYWFYRNWKHFKTYKNLDIRPGWRTVGLFVPIYGLVLIYNQLEDIRNFSKQVGIDKTFSLNGVFLGFFLLSLLWKLPDPFWLITFLSVLPLAVVQSVLNLYWKKEQPDFIEKTRFSGGQIALLVIGGIWWILALVGLFIPE